MNINGRTGKSVSRLAFRLNVTALMAYALSYRSNPLLKYAFTTVVASVFIIHNLILFCNTLLQFFQKKEGGLNRLPEAVSLAGERRHKEALQEPHFPKPCWRGRTWEIRLMLPAGFEPAYTPRSKQGAILNMHAPREQIIGGVGRFTAFAPRCPLTEPPSSDP